MPAEDPVPTAEAKKILIVEDDRASLLALAQMVQSAGYTVITAGDSADAIRTFELELPDLMLVDIDLRGENIGQPLDGLGMIDWLNYRHPDHRIKYIIVSPDDPEKHQGRAAAIGASCFIQKPFEMNLLLAEIRRAIGEPLDQCQPGTANPEPQ
jgi:DNA-binding response OmpR family regulator